MRPKKIKLNDNTVIIDGFSKLIVIDGKFAEQILGDFHKEQQLIKGVSCTAVPFTTKKGRSAIHVYSGESHIFRLMWGSGSRWWRGWDERRIVNGLFSEAKATSNGGGCWLEIEIWESSVTPITAEQAGYMEEL